MRRAVFAAAVVAMAACSDKSPPAPPPAHQQPAPATETPREKATRAVLMWDGAVKVQAKALDDAIKRGASEAELEDARKKLQVCKDTLKDWEQKLRMIEAAPRR